MSLKNPENRIYKRIPSNLSMYLFSFSIISLSTGTTTVRRSDSKCHKIPVGRGNRFSIRITWVGVTIKSIGTS